ncbi:unnamed protein product [Darwinula stevensoni]|uniref:Uncharacterized protein n=1 Tax=Darwinula stevensoni TaxID=69355 RepID=A0A7R8XEC2_9CRUS|nr:unnamed protein product [Darwinula stevensoni]CAG0895645.1 unnamed protein product [Darwinula stevensoni]
MGKKNVTVIDGKKRRILETFEEIISFIKEEGIGKDVLFDEVPLTLGMPGRPDEESLSNHWKGIIHKVKGVKSLTVAFRPHDETYKSDISLSDIKIDDVDINVMKIVMRNTWNVTKLFLALGDTPGYRKPLYAVVDTTERRNYLVNILQDVYRTPVGFVDEHGMIHGKSKTLLRRIEALGISFQSYGDSSTAANQEQIRQGILLLHMGSALCQKDSLDHLRTYRNVLEFRRTDALSPNEIVNYNGLHEVQWTLHSKITNLFVDDYCIQAPDMDKERENWLRALEELNKKERHLLLTVNPKLDVEVIELPDSEHPNMCTDPQFLEKILINETSKSLQLGVNSLATGSHPGALVPGPMPKRISISYQCLEQHAGYKCKGQEKYVLEQVKNLPTVHVLLSDANLMKLLQSSEDCGENLTFVHPNDFRGCESNVVVSVNVDTFYLLESLSRARTQLFIIDYLLDNEEAWRTMEKDKRVDKEVVQDHIALDNQTLLSLDNFGKFLVRGIFNEKKENTI